MWGERRERTCCFSARVCVCVCVWKWGEGGGAVGAAISRQDDSTNAYLSHANWRARLKKSTHLIN